MIRVSVILVFREQEDEKKQRASIERRGTCGLIMSFLEPVR